MKLDITAALSDDAGVLADQLAEVKAVRLLMAKEVEKVETFEKSIKEKIISLVPKTSAGVMGQRYKAVVTTKDKLIVGEQGWGKFWDYVLKSGRTDLVQKRLADRAVADMYEQGQTIPGVEKMNVVDVSLTKI